MTVRRPSLIPEDRWITGLERERALRRRERLMTLEKAVAAGAALSPAAQEELVLLRAEAAPRGRVVRSAEFSRVELRVVVPDGFPAVAVQRIREAEQFWNDLSVLGACAHLMGDLFTEPALCLAHPRSPLSCRACSARHVGSPRRGGHGCCMLCGARANPRRPLPLSGTRTARRPGGQLGPDNTRLVGHLRVVGVAVCPACWLGAG